MIHYCPLAPEADASQFVPTKVVMNRAGRAMLGAVSVIAFLTTVAFSLGAQPPVTAAPAGARPAADSSAPKPRNLSWLSDTRAFRVGDILKVNVNEYTLATANKGSSADAARSRKMGIDIEPPTIGAVAMGPIEGSVGTGDAGRSHQNGVATNSTSYLGVLPVRVVAVTKEGLLQVTGTKMIDVDKNKQAMTLTGFIRPQDVNSQDVVLSTSVADLQLAYQSKGALGKPKNGIVSKILGIFWP